MVSEFVKIIDRLIDLANVKQKNDKEFFNSILEPFFSEFEVVVKGYFKLFDSAHKSETELLAIRDEYIQTRLKVTSLAKRYKELSRSRQLIDFFNLVDEFFFATFKIPAPTQAHFESRIPQSSIGQTFIDLATGEMSFDYTYILNEQKIRLWEKWESIVEKYAELQFEHDLPKGYKP